MVGAQGPRAATLQAGASVSEAIARAQAGDTVLVSGPGAFHEHIVLDKPLILQGTNSPVLDADGRGTAVTIKSAGCEVLDICVRNGGTDLGQFDSGIMLMGPGARVLRCHVEGGGFGIYIRGVNGCRIEDNFIAGDTHVPPSQRGNGIHLWKTKDNVIARNRIIDTRDGAYFSYADRNLISSNHIERTRFGIHYMYSHENRLLDNVLEFNAVGAALMFARNCAVQRNHAIGNRRHGILLKQVERSTFCGNIVRGQNRGFFIQQASQDRFEENLLAENDIGLYLSNGSEQNVFTGNAFIRNTDQVWQPSDEVDLGRLASNQFAEKGRGNFWSDYTGTDANGDGIGDTPYHETDLYGYMVDRNPEARVFALSPAAMLLRKGEELLPLLNSPGVTDPCPLQAMPASLRSLLTKPEDPNRLVSVK